MQPDRRLEKGHASHQQSSSEIVALIPALRAFARTFCRNTSDADDLVQETLTKALAKIEQFEAGTSLKSWLFTIMRNTFYTQAKLARREAPGVSDCASTRRRNGRPAGASFMKPSSACRPSTARSSCSWAFSA